MSDETTEKSSEAPKAATEPDSEGDAVQEAAPAQSAGSEAPDADEHLSEDDLADIEALEAMDDEPDAAPSDDGDDTEQAAAADAAYTGDTDDTRDAEQQTASEDEETAGDEDGEPDVEAEAGEAAQDEDAAPATAPPKAPRGKGGNAPGPMQLTILMAERKALGQQVEELSAKHEELDGLKRELEAERDKLRDQLLRTAADFDNFRRRTRRDLEDAKRRGGDDSIRELLPVFDNLERAVTASEGSAEVGPVLEGIRMVLRMFEDTAQRMDLTRIPGVGARFDPTVHEAIQQLESAEFEAGTIMTEVAPGYLIGERLLRAAVVIVSRGPAKPPDPPAAPEPSEETSDAGPEAGQTDGKGSESEAPVAMADSGDRDSAAPSPAADAGSDVQADAGEGEPKDPVETGTEKREDGEDGGTEAEDRPAEPESGESDEDGSE